MHIQCTDEGMFNFWLLYKKLIKIIISLMIHLLADDSYVMSSLCIIFGVRSLKHFMYSSCELKFDG